MHDILRERLMRGLEALPEERLYQVLDYVEFLGSKYARDGARTAGSPLRRFSERLEDHMRLQGVGLSAIKGTMGVMDTADRFVNDLTEAGKSLLKEVEAGVRGQGPGVGGQPSPSRSSTLGPLTSGTKPPVAPDPQPPRSTPNGEANP